MSDIPKSLRTKVVARSKSRCEYCQIPTEGQIAWFPIDHIIPRNQNGETCLENLALSCPRCNGHKWAFDQAADPKSGAEVSLFNPRTQKWDDHFRWNCDGSLSIEGQTPTGRATVDRLKMNDPEILEIRSLLAELGIEVGCFQV